MRKLRKYKKGDVIIEEGAQSTEAYILLSGSVEVSRSIDVKKVVLAILKPKQIFGEMGLIDERPRSATITALEPVELKVIKRETFDELIMSDSDSIKLLLQSFVERLRLMNQTITELEVYHEPFDIKNWEIRMVGITSEGKQTVGEEGILIEKFPFYVGRESSKEHVLSNNDLVLPDQVPYNVSRNHFAIVRISEGIGIGIVDRGSMLGTIVNESILGGSTKKAEIALQEGENEIIVGLHDSLYKFHIILQRIKREK